MTILFPVPICIFTVLALMFLVFSRKPRGLKAILVASYCGVTITSFTGGSSGAIWLGPLFLLMIGPMVIWRPKEPSFAATGVVRFMHATFIFFIIGIIVGLIRYDPSVEVIKAGRYKALFGIPTNFLMAVYRVHVVAFLYLAFTVPQRYYIDRYLFIKCLKLCWFFTVVLAVGGIVDYFGIADLAFELRTLRGYEHVAVMGFAKTSYGLILISGIFISLAMTQLTQSHLMRIFCYVSMPIFIVSLLFSWSRTSIFAVTVGLLSLAVTLGWTKILKGVLIILFAGIAMYVTVAIFPELQWQVSFLRIFVGAPEAADTLTYVSTGRVREWMNLLGWLFESPGVLLFGAGFQNFNYFAHLHAGASRLETGHNTYLHMLTELGIGGFFVFMGWLMSIILWLLSWQRTMVDRRDKMIPGLFISLVLTVMAGSLTGEVLAPALGMVPWLVLFYLTLGIWISYYRSQMMELNDVWWEEDLDYTTVEKQEMELYQTVN